VDVLTVFAGEPDPPLRGWWDEVCGFASSADSVPVRNREDEEALRPGGHRRLLLDLLEVQHIDGPRAPHEKSRIAEAVQTWLAETGGGTIALPAGAGWAPYWVPARIAIRLRKPRGPEPHDDHAFTRDAVLESVREAEFLLYEELPYLWGGPADRAARRAAAINGRQAHIEVAHVDRQRKARRMAAYTTQIPHMSPSWGRLDSPDVLPPTERYWRLLR
jgi:hypothetical protein